MRIKTIVEREDITPRSHGRVMRIINRELSERHAKSRVPRHFQRNRWTSPRSGAYRYLPRSKRTIERKRKLGKDPYRPNYQTGEMLAAITGSSQTTATQHRWVWRAKNPAFPLADWRRRELEAIGQDEVADDTKTMGRRYVQLARRREFRRKRRKRVG